MQGTPSYASFAKVIVEHIAPTLKTAGFRKRRNAFNRQLDNGLIHHFSLRLMSTTSSMHGKFCYEAGCYVPASELYSPTEADPKWISIYNCCIQEHIVKRSASGQYAYLDAKYHARDPARSDPYVASALEALQKVRSYDQLMSEDDDIAPLHFATPKGIVQCCIALNDGDKSRARAILDRYLTEREQSDKPHTGHIQVVREWGKKHGLL